MTILLSLPLPYLATVSLMSELITGSEADEGGQVCATITNYNKHHNNISVNIVPSPWDNPKTAGMSHNGM